MIETFEGGGTLVRLTGNLDESFNADGALGSLSGGAVIFDVDQVQRVSSFGVRVWLHFIRGLKAEYWALMRCRPAMLRQIAQVHGFLDRGQLLSWYMVYYCLGCNAEIEKLFSLGVDLDRHREPCARCGQLMVTDDAPGALEALSHQSTHPVLPLVAHIISGTAKPRTVKRTSVSSRPGDVKMFNVVLATPNGHDLGQFEAWCQAADELYVRLPNAPLPLMSRVQVKLGTAECTCNVTSGFSSGRLWVSALKLHRATPTFLEALEKVGGAPKTPRK